MWIFLYEECILVLPPITIDVSYNNFALCNQSGSWVLSNFNFPNKMTIFEMIPCNFIRDWTFLFLTKINIVSWRFLAIPEQMGLVTFGRSERPREFDVKCPWEKIAHKYIEVHAIGWASRLISIFMHMCYAVVNRCSLFNTLMKSRWFWFTRWRWWRLGEGEKLFMFELELKVHSKHSIPLRKLLICLPWHQYTYQICWFS